MEHWRVATILLIRKWYFLISRIYKTYIFFCTMSTMSAIYSPIIGKFHLTIFWRSIIIIALIIVTPIPIPTPLKIPANKLRFIISLFLPNIYNISIILLSLSALFNLSMFLFNILYRILFSTIYRWYRPRNCYGDRRRWKKHSKIKCTNSTP